MSRFKTNEEKQKEIDVEGLNFIGLDFKQFATILVLSQTAQQLKDLIEKDEAKVMFKAHCKSNIAKSLAGGLGWVADNRDDLIRLASAVNFAQNLLGQVSDGLIQLGLNGAEPAKTEQPKEDKEEEVEE